MIVIAVAAAVIVVVAVFEIFKGTNMTLETPRDMEQGLRSTR